MATLVITAIGNDRPGLVDALAEPIVNQGGSWNRSHMARLAGQFAGIVEISIPEENIAALKTSFVELGSSGLLRIDVAVAAAFDEGAESSVMRLHVVGHDRPGIVRQIASALAANDVSILELQSEVASAPMSAESLFDARLTVSVPADLDVDRLTDALEAIGQELMVDVDFGEVAGQD